VLFNSANVQASRSSRFCHSGVASATPEQLWHARQGLRGAYWTSTTSAAFTNRLQYRPDRWVRRMRGEFQLAVGPQLRIADTFRRVCEPI